MRILIISSCTGKKRYEIPNQLSKNDFMNFDTLQRKTIGLKKYECSAMNMYTGEQHIRLKNGMKVLSDSKVNSSLFILSAGYGLISSEKLIVPYNVTFSGMKLSEIDHDLGFILLGENYLRALKIKVGEKFSIPLIFIGSSKIASSNSNAIFCSLSGKNRKYSCGNIGLKGEVFSRLIRYIQNSGWNKIIENPSLVNSII